MTDSSRPQPQVQHREADHRFEVETPSGPAYLAYRPSADGRVLDLQHTIVPKPEEGAGIGTALVEAAIAHARQQGLKIIPTCRFVHAYVRRHKETRALVAPETD